MEVAHVGDASQRFDLVGNAISVRFTLALLATDPQHLPGDKPGSAGAARSLLPIAISLHLLHLSTLTHPNPSQAQTLADIWVSCSVRTPPFPPF